MMVESRSQDSVALRDYFERLREADLAFVNRRFIDAEKAVAAALAAADRAVEKAEKASEKRADASNEIRGAMMDAQANFLTKVEGTGLEHRISMVENALSQTAGRMLGTTSSSDLAFRVIAALGVVAGIAGVIYGLSK